MRIGFIGGGVMAEAMLSRALAEGITHSGDALVAEPLPDRRDYLSRTYGIAVTADNREAAAGAALVTLAMKPQHFEHAAHDLHGGLEEHQTVMSIVAGLTVKTIERTLGHRSIIRVMPNTPAQVGAGMSVWTATDEVPAPAREAGAALLRVMGREWYVEEERYLDMATALSGSGPAYVFAFLESLIEAGVYMGMPRDMAQTLAIQTVLGSAKLADETGQNPALLREMVTSPGGTTAEALREMERRGFRSTMIEAVSAAYRRARELGGKD